MIVVKPQHSEHKTIWCVVSARGLLGPYYVEDDNGNRVIVNQIHYAEKIIQLFLREDFSVLESWQWFQQYCITCHIAINTVISFR